MHFKRGLTLYSLKVNRLKIRSIFLSSQTRQTRQTQLIVSPVAALLWKNLPREFSVLPDKWTFKVYQLLPHDLRAKRAQFMIFCALFRGVILDC